MVLSSQPAFAELIRSALLESGKYLVTAIDSIDEIRNLEPSTSFDALVLDIDQPVDEQLHVLTNFQRFQPGLKTILLLTTSFDTRSELNGLHINKVLHKPIYLPDFLEEIEHSLRNAEFGEKSQDQLEKALPGLLLDARSQSDANLIAYFLNGSLLATVGDSKELIVEDIVSFLEERAEKPFHADFIKYKQLAGNSEPLLIYFKAIEENELLVMVFAACIPLRDARQQINQVKQRLLSFSPRNISIPATINTEDTQENRVQNGESFGEMKGAAVEPAENKQKGEDLESQSPREFKATQSRSSEFLPGWIREGAEEDEDLTIPTLEKLESEHLKENPDLQVVHDVNASTTQILNTELGEDLQAGSAKPSEWEDDDFPAESGQQVNTVDQLLSASGHEEPSADLLAGLIFPWDAQDEVDGTILPTEVEPELGQTQVEPETPLSPADIDAPQKAEVRLQPESPGQASLCYTCLLIPRFHDQFLVGMISQLLAKSIPQICIAYDWRLDRLTIRPTHVQWTIFASPKVAPAKIIRIMRKETSKAVFELKPDFLKGHLSNDFWAPGYLLLSGYLPPSQSMVKEYVHGTRQAQGVLLPTILKSPEEDQGKTG